MTDAHHRLLTESGFKHLLHLGHDGRIPVGLPGAVLAVHRHLHARHGEGTLEHLLQVFEIGSLTAASQNSELRTTLTHVDDGQIGRRLHNAGNGGNVAQHTVVTGHNGVHEVVPDLGRHLLRRLLRCSERQGDAVLNETELLPERLLAISHEVVQILHILFRQRKHNFAGTGNGVAHVTALPAYQTGIVVLNGLAHYARHQLVGIGPAFMYLTTGMAAAKTLQAHPNRDVVCLCFLLLILQLGRDVDASGAAYDKLSVGLFVEIEQNVTVQRIGREIVHTVHTRLLVGRNQGFNRAVLQIF